MKKLVMNFFGGILLYASCTAPINEGFRSIELISSQGERLYINSVNYGITSDHQMTIITKDKDQLKFGIDTNNVVVGLDPFLYSFRNDTLTLFFNQSANYKIADTFTTIKISYKIVSNSIFMDMMSHAITGKELNKVPELKRPEVNSSIPKSW